MAATAARGALSGDLSRRHHRQDPRRRPRPQQGRSHRGRRRHRRDQARARGSGCKPPRAPSSGRRCAPSSPTVGVRDVLIVCCDGLTGFPEAIAATWPRSDRADLCRASDPGGDAVRELRGPQSRRCRVEADLPGCQRRRGARSSSRRSRPRRSARNIRRRSRRSVTRGSGSRRSWRSRRRCAG